MNQGAFLTRGLENVRAEFSLTALVYNLRRALNILGVTPMMARFGGESCLARMKSRRASTSRILKRRT
jgi:hypothetical protein